MKEPHEETMPQTNQERGKFSKLVLTFSINIKSW